MRFVNFELENPSFSVELFGLGYVWDLHNSGEFLGLQVFPDDNSALLRWMVTGNPSEKYSECILKFSGLSTVRISPRDLEVPYSEDRCVSGISKIVPEAAEKPEYRTRAHWDRGDKFNLRFEFQSGRMIDIDAETVELIGIT